MKRFIFSLFLLLNLVETKAQSARPADASTIARPKLVVGIVVDQMRWDFLYRYYDRYLPNGGFKRMLQQGFSCENAFIPYAPTVTACGHATIYTGSVPNIHGITGNAWWDNLLNRSMYCVEDETVKTVGSADETGAMSPRNMLTTTITDELRLSNNFQSKVIGIAPKDRGAILPAGHSANGAYWYNSKTGNWISSDYYVKQLPNWINEFNDRKMPDVFYEKGWSTLYPIETYTQSARDENDYEGKAFGAQQKGFPYDLKRFAKANYSAISVTPYGASLTLEISKAAIEGEKLGSGKFTDFLTISLSSPDYIGHTFGPNSIECEDTYLRLDKDLGAFFDYLDAKVGKGQYLCFLSADHGVAHVPAFMKENKLPGGVLNDDQMMKDLSAKFTAAFGTDKLINSTYNYQIYLNHETIESQKLNEAAVKKTIIDFLKKQEPFAEVFEIDKMMTVPMEAKKRTMLANGYFPSRSGDIQMVLKPGWIDGMTIGTTHGLWNPYDSHIPLVWYGWNIKQGKTYREVYMTDIAATLAAMLHIQMPSGCIGNVIEEVLK